MRYFTYGLCVCFIFDKEPIRVPSATASVADELEDDASSLLVTRLMQTGNSRDVSPGRQTAASAAAAAAGVSGDGVKSSLADRVNGNNSIVDLSPEQRSADNLHQLSLYAFVLNFLRRDFY